jgi:hypothetical protein
MMRNLTGLVFNRMFALIGSRLIGIVSPQDEVFFIGAIAAEQGLYR